MKKIIIIFLLYSGCIFSQGYLIRSVELGDSLAGLRAEIPSAQSLKKIYSVITNGSVTTWNVFGFSSDATYSISADTLIITDASGELNFEGMIISNNLDYTIVGTPTTSEIKIEWGGFASKTISVIWQLDTLSVAFPVYEGTINSNFVLTSEIITGTDSIHYGEDSIVVSHGVGSTPSFVSIQLVSDGFGFQTWVSGINSLTFYVRRSDTGLKTINSSIQFKWMAYK